MSHRIFRAEQVAYAADVKLGKGAELYGGRWNTAGRPAIYCASTLSLATLEILVHLKGGTSRIERVYFTLDLDELQVEVLARPRVPADFNSATPYALTQPLGDAWLAAGRTVALKVPSAVIPTEFNFILNPAHPDFARAVTWFPQSPLKVDPRLLVGPPAAPIVP